MPVVETKTEKTPVAAREPATRHDVTAPQLGALGFETQAVFDLQATAGNTAVTALLTAGAAASDGAGPAGSDDAGGGSAAGVGGGGSLPSKPAAPVPDLSGFSPPDGLHRVVGLPPAQLLASLGGIVAAISHSATREHNALRARPPDWQIAPDVPTSPGAHDSASVAVAGPPASAAPPVPATADPEAATVVHRHVAFHQEIEGEARSHAIAAAAPMGEHAIAAGSVGAVAAAVAVHPASATAPDLHLEDDEGVSRVAADERGGDIAAAVQAGATTMAQLETEHAGKQAELRRHAEREATHLETENRAKRDAERGAALEHVTGLRREWGGERSTVIAEAQGAGERASETATSAIKAHQAEAEHQAVAARAEGRREADRARTRGQGGGILGAIGSAAQSLVDKVASAVRSVMSAAEHLATQALERGRHLIQATIANAGNLFAAAAGRARSLLAAARDRFQRAIADRIARARAAVTGLMITVRAAVKATLDTCAKALGASVQVLQAGWHATVDGVRGVVQGALQFARGAIQALGTFGALVRDVAANPGQWLRNLAAGAQDGIRNHLWPDLQQGVREWINSKVDAVLGIGEAVWMLLKHGGITVAEVGHMLWEGIKAAIPPTLISILIEKIVSLLVPAAGLALLIIQGIQAAWSSLSRITQAFGAFMSFLKGVRWGNAGALFGKALSAGAVALLDFVSNLLLRRIGGPIKKVAGKVRAIASRIGGGVKRGLGGAKRWAGVAGADAAAFVRRHKDRFLHSRLGEKVMSPVTKARSARVGAELKARGGSAPIHLTPREFAKSEDAQVSLYSAARKVQLEQDAFGKGLLEKLGVKGEAYSILKREDPQNFTEGILKKCQRKGYTNIGQMDDIARGRFNLPTSNDVERVVDALEQQTKYRSRRIDPRAIEGVEGGYARYHVILTDPDTGLTHEWQVGTSSVTDIYEAPTVRIPKELEPLPAGMSPSLHDVEYDVLGAIQRDYPALGRKYGIRDLRRRIALLASQAGRHGDQMAGLKEASQPLYEETSRVLAEITHDKGPGFVRRYFH